MFVCMLHSVVWGRQTVLVRLVLWYLLWGGCEWYLFREDMIFEGIGWNSGGGDIRV